MYIFIHIILPLTHFNTGEADD